MSESDVELVNERPPDLSVARLMTADDPMQRGTAGA